MLRIVMIVFRGLFSLPSWYTKLRKIKDDPNVSREERYGLAKRICAWIIKHGSIKPTITGLENIPSEQGYLIAPNHQGLFDAVLICHSHPTYTSAVVKIELENTFFVKDLIALLYARCMDRDNLRQSMKVIKDVGNDMKSGINYIIFPEGTRSKKGNVLGEFKGGSFKSAMNAKAPILPVAMVDCFKVFDQNSLGTVYPQVHYLKPIPYEEYKDWSTSELSLEVQSRIEKKIAECLQK